MFDLLVFIAVWLLFIFVTYSILPFSISKNKKFDILIIFPILFLMVGRVLELVFVTDLSSVGWSLFPVTEENQEIAFFSELPWLFFNIAHLIFNWNWILLRLLFALVILKTVFKFDKREYQETKSAIFHNLLLAIALIFIWLNSTGKVQDVDKIYSNYLLIAFVSLYCVFLYFRIIKKTFLSISWGVIIIIFINSYFILNWSPIFVHYDAPNNGRYIIEILIGLLILFFEHFRKIRLNSTVATDVTFSRLSIARSNFSQQQKRNLLNEINSKFKKN